MVPGTPYFLSSCVFAMRGVWKLKLGGYIRALSCLYVCMSVCFYPDYPVCSWNIPNPLRQSLHLTCLPKPQRTRHNVVHQIWESNSSHVPKSWSLYAYILLRHHGVGFRVLPSWPNLTIKKMIWLSLQSDGRYIEWHWMIKSAILPDLGLGPASWLANPNVPWKALMSNGRKFKIILND